MPSRADAGWQLLSPAAAVVKRKGRPSWFRRRYAALLLLALAANAFVALRHTSRPGDGDGDEPQVPAPQVLTHAQPRPSSSRARPPAVRSRNVDRSPALPVKKKKSKPRLPYDIDQPADGNSLYSLHLNGTVPLVMAQDSMRGGTERRKDGLDFYNVVVVQLPEPTRVIQDESESRERIQGKRRRLMQAAEGEREEEQEGEEEGGGEDAEEAEVEVEEAEEVEEVEEEDGTDVEAEAEAEAAEADGRLQQRLVFRLARATYARLPQRQPTWAFNTCAVVGNSGALLHRRLGRAIDAHDAVLRINNAPLIGFAPQVGAKTTFSLVNQHHAKQLAYERVAKLHEDASLLVFESTFASVRLEAFPRLLSLYQGELEVLLFAPELTVTAHLMWLKLKALVEQKNRELAESATSLSSAGAGGRRKGAAHVRTSFKRKPMTGFFAVLFMAQHCRSIDLYGFSNYNRYELDGARKGKTPYHYFDSVPGAVRVHSFELSLHVFRLMASVHNITLK